MCSEVAMLKYGQRETYTSGLSDILATPLLSMELLPEFKCM